MNLQFDLGRRCNGWRAQSLFETQRFSLFVVPKEMLFYDFRYESISWFFLLLASIGEIFPGAHVCFVNAVRSAIIGDPAVVMSWWRC